jgi:hypothetical protein
MTEERRGRSGPGDEPAFPCDYSMARPQKDGMSKREHYASLLLAGMNANPANNNLCHAHMIDMALDQTDQLLKALAKADQLPEIETESDDLPPVAADRQPSELTPEETMINKFGIGKQCIIRTYSAGVHFGELVDRAGTEVLLKNARRIHYWEGAFTLNAIALNGASDNSRLSEPVPEILLTEAIEILPCSEAGAKWLSEKESHDTN